MSSFPNVQATSLLVIHMGGGPVDLSNRACMSCFLYMNIFLSWTKCHVNVTCIPPDGSLAGMLLNDEGGSDPLPLDQSLYYMQQILQGVYHLHSCSIVHLDIKGEVLKTPL